MKLTAWSPSGACRGGQLPPLGASPHSPQRGHVVALALPRPADLAAAFGGLLAQGCVPLVLPPTLPSEAQRRTATSAGAVALWAQEGDHVVSQPLPGDLRLSHRGYLACTSGTTGGHPKFYAFTEHAAERNARAHLRSLGVTDASRLVLPMSLAHSFGLVAGWFAARLTGAELVAFEDTPNPSTLLSVATQQPTDILYITPPLMRLLLKRARRRPVTDGVAPRVVSVGSGPVERDELRALVALFPESRVTFTYGLTELGPRVATLVAGDRGVDRVPPGPGRAPLGEPLDGVTWDVRDDRLFVRSPFAAVGRLVDHGLVPLETTDGAFDTRDAVRRGSAGVEVVGRADGAIVRGGTNVYPEDVEAVAQRDGAITGACCVARPSSMYGEVPVLYCESATDDAPLRARLAQRFDAELRPVERPVELHVLPALPRSPLGKVLRADVVATDRAASCHAAPRSAS